MSSEIDYELEQIMKSGDETQAREAFAKFDKDRSGTIEVKELGRVLKAIDFDLSGEATQQDAHD